jgi:4-amino-4-deoxy-L-arabinose transferase-like glycosyltransferase
MRAMIAAVVAVPQTLKRASFARASRPGREKLALAAITLLAGGLRLWSLRLVPNDPFYDAAVRSMALSWHNFFFGAYEPGASLAVDKPPFDLWLQVISTQLLGYGSVALKLPPALAGTFAAPLLYDAVRRINGPLAGLASALVLAVLPIAVLSSRSDTMDSVAMFLNVLALWHLVRFAQTDRSRWCYLAAAAMGLAFNVKVFQGLVCLPALLLFGLMVCHRQRARRLVLCAVVFTVVALSWLTATLAFPASQRPYAIGSTNGSAWNAAFVYNGYDRLVGKATQSLLNAQGASPLRPANNSEPERAAVAIAPPSPLRLFKHNDPLSGLRLGFVLLAALLLGIPALIEQIVRARGPDERARRAFAAALLAWLLIGFVLYSAMARLHPRYAEGFTPAVAAGAGIGLVWALRTQYRRFVLPIAAVAFALYALYLFDVSSPVVVATVLGAALAIGALALGADRVPGALRGRGLRIWLLGAGLGAAALVLPLRVSLGLVANHEYDSGFTGFIGPATVAEISGYISAHRDGAHYEFVVADPSTVGSLIVHDLQPILSLTSYGDHELLATPRLARLVSTGAVRFAYIGGPCVPRNQLELPRCSAGASWVRAHGIDVSRTIGLDQPDMLYFLPRRYRPGGASQRHTHTRDPGR